MTNQTYLTHADPQIVKQITKHRQVSKSEPLWIIFDCGNTDVKAMIHTHFGEEILIPHSVRMLSGKDYESLEAAYKNKSADFNGTAIFKTKDQGYVVGRHAQQIGNGITLTGASKYTRQQMGALLKAALINLYPDSHPDVRLTVLHPPRITNDNLKSLYEAVAGKHIVTLPDGRKFTWNVTEVIDLEEPVAALQHFMLTQTGRAYKESDMSFTPGSEFLVLDVGGGISVFVPCVITDDCKIEVNLFGAPPIPKGIQDVIPVLTYELKSDPVLAPLIGNLTTIPDSMIHNALMTGEITIRGVAYNCEAHIDNAMQTLAQPIQMAYKNQYNEGASASGVLVSGGGGGASFNYLSVKVLVHPFTYPIDPDPKRMRYGALNGASKGQIGYMARKGLTTHAYQV